MKKKKKEKSDFITKPSVDKNFKISNMHMKVTGHVIVSKSFPIFIFYITVVVVVVFLGGRETFFFSKQKAHFWSKQHSTPWELMSLVKCNNS